MSSQNRTSPAAPIIVAVTLAFTILIGATGRVIPPSQQTPVRSTPTTFPNVADPSCLVTSAQIYADATNPVPHDFPSQSNAVSLQTDPNSGDQGYGFAQVYVSGMCLTCNQSPGGPSPTAIKLFAAPSPKSDWILFTSEMPSHQAWGTGANLVYQQNNGYYMDLWLTNMSGSVWYNVTNNVWDGANRDVNGTLSPKISPDETKLVWAEHTPDGDTGALEDWQIAEVPLAPNGSGGLTIGAKVYLNAPYPPSFYEIHGWFPDGRRMLVSGAPGVSLEGPVTNSTFPYGALGSDVYVVDSGTSPPTWTDVTRAIDPTGVLWEEHSFLSPHGNKVAVEAEAPNPPVIGPPLNDQNNPFATWRGDVTLELWVVGVDGSRPVQITGAASPAIGEPQPWWDPSDHHSASQAQWNLDGDQMKILIATNPPGNGTQQTGQTYLVQFNGVCG